MEVIDLCKSQNDRRGHLKRIQERRPPLVLSPSEVERIAGYTKQNADMACKTALRRKEMSEKHALSQEMSSTWPNTVANLRKQRFKVRSERMEKEVKRRQQVYEEMNAFSHAKKEEQRKVAKEKLFQDRDEVKNFLSAYKFGEALRVRDVQAKHNAKLREEEKRLKDEYERGILEDAEKFRQEEISKKEEKMKEKLKLRNEILGCLQKRKEERELEEKKQKEEEQCDLFNMKKEIEAFEAKEKEIAEEKRREIRLNIRDSKLNKKKKEEQERLEELERDEAIRLISESKKRINRIRKEKEAEIRAAASEKQEKVKEQLVQAADTTAAKEDEIYLKDKARLEELEDKSREEREEHYNQLIIERKAAEREYFRLAKQKEERAQELEKFDLLQRFKRNEANNAFNKNMKDKSSEMKIIRAEDVKRQRIQDNQRRAENRDNFMDYFKNLNRGYQMHDDEFLAYAKHLVEMSQQCQRPTYPMDVNLQSWKKNVGLLRGIENFLLSKPPEAHSENFVETPEKNKGKCPPDPCQTQIKNIIVQAYSKIAERANGLLEDKDRVARLLKKNDPETTKIMDDIYALANGLQDLVLKTK